MNSMSPICIFIYIAKTLFRPNNVLVVSYTPNTVVESRHIEAVLVATFLRRFGFVSHTLICHSPVVFFEII